MNKILAVIIASLLLPTVVQANNYPSRPISMIVPYAPGGSTDALARVIANAMGKALNQTIVVENVGGGGGIIGLQKLMHANADGYTISFGNMGNFAIAGTLYPKANYDPRRDLEPIGLVASVPMVLSVSQKSGIKNMKELLEKSQGSQKQLNFGNSGAGSTGHISSVYFNSVTNGNVEQISYRGAGPSIADLMAGTLDAVIDQTVTMIPASKGGRILPIAISGDKRVGQLPNVPTFKEAGVPAFDMKVWNAIVAPKGTPPAVIDKLSAALEASFSNNEVIAKMETFAAPIPAQKERGPAALKQLIDSEVERFAKLIKDNNIHVNE